VKASDFLDGVGLNATVTAWLRQNAGDPLREDVVRELINAFQEDCPPQRVGPLNQLIVQIEKRIR